MSIFLSGGPRTRGLVATGIALLTALLVAPQPIQASSFNPSNLISDSEFIDVNAMTVDEIQRLFLAALRRRWPIGRTDHLGCLTWEI